MAADHAFAPYPESSSEAGSSPLDVSDHTLAAEWAELLHDRQLHADVLACSKQEDYAGAIARLEELLACRPAASDYNNRGLMHFKLGHYEQALADYDLALALEPRLDSAYNNRANCYVVLGDLASAIADYEIALDFNPGNLRARINQGITYRDLGLYDLALENFDLVLLLGRRLQGRAYAERGRTHHLQGDWNLAIADYQQALDLLASSRSARHCAQRVQRWLAELNAPLTA